MDEDSRATDVLVLLRRLREALVPDGMVSLQVGGIGELPPTEDKTFRIMLSGGVTQHVNATDDELEESDLEANIVKLVTRQKEEMAEWLG